MNQFKPVSALAGFSAILVLGIVFSSIPEVHAELNPIEIEEKIQAVEDRLSTLQEDSEEFNIYEIGSKIFQFRVIGESLIEIQEKFVNSNIQDYSEEVTQYEILKIKYLQALENYQNDVREYEKSSSVSLQEKKLIAEFKKDSIAFKVIVKSLDAKLQIKETIANAIKQVQIEKEFRELIREVSIDQAIHNRLIKTYTNTLQLTIHQIVDSESWDLLSLAINKTIEQYSDDETKQEIREQANIILDAVNKIKDIDTDDDLPDAGDDLPDTGDDLPDTGDDLPDTGDDLPDAGDDLPDTGDDINYRMIKPLSVHYDMNKEVVKNAILKIENVALKLKEQNEIKWQQHRDDSSKKKIIYSESSNDGEEKSTDKGNKDKGNSQGKGNSGDKGNKDKGNSQGNGNSGDKGNSQGKGNSGDKGNKKA